MFGTRLTLFRLFGFEVRMDLSWTFLAILVTWSLAKGYFPTTVPGLSQATYWWMGLAGVIGLLFSLVFHELAHSLVARRYGMSITGITLFVFGGVAEMEDEPPSAKSEFLMAIAGPLSSFLLAGCFYLLAAMALHRGVPVAVVGVVQYLAWINGILALFNLVPAFPLDGGRVFRAALWYWRQDFGRATRQASRLGGGFGYLLIAIGLFNVLTGNFVGGMWWFLIGMFLRAAADASYYQAMARRVLLGAPVSRFMTTRPITVPPDLSLDRLVADYIYQYHHTVFPVTDGRYLMGSIGTREVKAVSSQQWPLLTVGEILTPCAPDNTITSETDALKALSIMQRTGNSRLMVTEHGRLVGILALKDMLRFLSLKIDLEESSNS